MPETTEDFTKDETPINESEAPKLETDETPTSPTDESTDAPTDAPTDASTTPPTDESTTPPTDAPTDASTTPPTDESTTPPTDETTTPPTDAPTDELVKDEDAILHVCSELLKKANNLSHMRCGRFLKGEKLSIGILEKIHTELQHEPTFYTSETKLKEVLGRHFGK